MAHTVKFKSFPPYLNVIILKSMIYCPPTWTTVVSMHDRPGSAQLLFNSADFKEIFHFVLFSRKKWQRVISVGKRQLSNIKSEMS